MPAKTKTRDQVRAMQQKAVRFLSDVVGDPDRANEFESMTPEDYAQTKGVQIKNPTKGKNTMAARPTRAVLEDRVAELEDENQTLNDKLDSILDIASEDDTEDDMEDDSED